MNDIDIAIKTMQTRSFCGTCTTASIKGLGSCRDCQSYKTKSLAVQALQEKRERDNPQPLTIEQLQQMDGQPVWCPIYGWGIVDTRFRRKKRINIVFAQHWKIAQNILLGGGEVYRSKLGESEE